MNMEEEKTERITTRITPVSRKQIGMMSTQLGLSESETIRTILDNSLGVSSAALKRVSEEIQRELKQLAFDRNQLHALRDLGKDVRREYGALSALGAHEAGLKKTPDPGFE